MLSLELHTLQFLLQGFDLRVGVMNELVHTLAEACVLFRQGFRKVFLVYDFL